MDTESIIRELERVEKKHKHEKVFTGQLNISEMARDVRKRIEELKPYEDTGLTPDQINALRERDEEKAPIWKDGFYGGLHCSVCDTFLPRRMPFCPNCGQRLKWED